jgi:hypothetical protein
MRVVHVAPPSDETFKSFHPDINTNSPPSEVSIYCDCEFGHAASTELHSEEAKAPEGKNAKKIAVITNEITDCLRIFNATFD